MSDIILENACVFAFYFGLAYFIGIIASDATDGMIKQTIEEKRAFAQGPWPQRTVPAHGYGHDPQPGPDQRVR